MLDIHLLSQQVGKKKEFKFSSVTASSGWYLNGFYLQTPTSATSGAIGSYSITGVQAVYGESTGQYMPPDPATELLKCLRFYQTNIGPSYSRILVPTNANGVAYGHIAFPVTMRESPDMTYSEPSSSTGLVGYINGIDVNRGGLSSEQYLSVRYAADAEIRS